MTFPHSPSGPRPGPPQGFRPGPPPQGPRPGPPQGLPPGSPQGFRPGPPAAATPPPARDADAAFPARDSSTEGDGQRAAHGGGPGGATGHPAVDAVLQQLANAAQLAPVDQIAEYEAAHRVLQETLASIDR